ncbi:hypothetical protein F7725_005106 [Dissostichus mawsoni]|uniref:Uncharacterized protein n=1 Tax=Dissostichus mawsoni TaxID=36200 RepID=A0A7J5YS49_DISMA|nr:hypothetical protein F7725_005106 [Dissostichus mawsoni]
MTFQTCQHVDSPNSSVTHPPSVCGVCELGALRHGPENNGAAGMAVAVSRDLTVTVLEDVNAAKLTERQQALRAAIQRGEPKCLGVSQMMLGLMVVSYSIPLLYTEVTEVVLLGVPWWSGLTLRVCLVVTMVSTLLSVVALIIYSVDMGKNPAVPCVKNPDGVCSELHHATSMKRCVSFQQRLSRGVKASLLIFTLAQTAISAVLCFLLFRQRHGFGPYAVRLQHFHLTSKDFIQENNTTTVSVLRHSQSSVKGHQEVQPDERQNSLGPAEPETPTALIPPELN